MKKLRLLVLGSLVLCGLAGFLVTTPVAANMDRCKVEIIPCSSDSDCAIAGTNCKCGGICVSG